MRQAGAYALLMYTEGTLPLRSLRGWRIEVGTWLSLVERTLGVGEVASSNLVVPTNSSAPHGSVSIPTPMIRDVVTLAPYVEPPRTEWSQLRSAHEPSSSVS